MTTFWVLAAIDYPGSSTRDFQSRLDAALAPFDYDTTVDPYRCYLEPDDLDHASAWLGDNPGQAQGTERGDIRAVLSRYLDEEVHTETIAGVDTYYYLSTRNRNAEFDGVRIGGSYAWTFQARDRRDPRLLLPPASDKIHPARADLVTGGPKGALDLEATRARREARAAKNWETYQEARSRLPDARSFSWYMNHATTDDRGLLVDDRGIKYGDQPLIQELNETRPFLAPCPIDELGSDRAAYLADERNRAFAGFAMLTAEGEWLKPGNIAKFGATDATPEQEVLYRQHINNYVDKLPDSVWLVALQCHY